ncbi:MAG: DNA internalization-related competence protein ComEC/Rec2 [Neptuniibacter sp.]
MRSWMICFVVGVVCATWQQELIPVFGCICIALLIIGALLCKSIPKRLPLCALLLGFLYTTCWGYWQLDHRLSENFLRSDWNVNGVVTGIPQTKDGTSRFILKVTELTPLIDSKEKLPELRNIRLSWFNPNTELKSGQQLSLEVRLKPPHGLINPEGFDYERWLLVRKIDATGYVRSVKAIVHEPLLSVSSFRQTINAEIISQHESRREKALLSALITGDKQLLSSDEWDLLRASGTVHLAVISGLHIGFMAYVGWMLGRLIGCLFFKYQREIPYLFALILSAAYMLTAGAELPTQRAFIMVAALLLSGWRLFLLGHWTRWWMAMTVVLVFSPLAIWETGFWLSFGAVACLIWCGQVYRFRWQDGIKLQFLLLVGMLPLYLIFFSGFSLIAPLVNILAIPLVSLIVPIEFLNLLSDGLFSPLVDLLVQVFWWLVEISSSVDWAYVEMNGISYTAVFLLGMAAALMLFPIGFLPKTLALFLVIPVFVGIDRSSSDLLKVWVYDVGQGLAVLIEVGDYHLLYDTGPSYRTGGSAFQRAIEPHFRQKGVSEIDRVVLSHNDNDHTGGFKYLAQEYEVQKLTTSFDVEYEHSQCSPGQSWSIDNVQFTFLSGSQGKLDNDRSCVLLVESGLCRLLIPGDIGWQAEHRLPIEKPLTWLIAAHHGSRFSSSSLFLQKIRPEIVIFSAGYGNAFNHPHPDVVKRVKSVDAESYNTATNGTIILRSKSDHACLSSSYRREQKRFWRSFKTLW